MGEKMGPEDNHGNGDVKRKRGRPVGQSDFLEPQEIQKIISIPDRRTKEGLRDYAVLVLLANTPLRKAEICSLRRENLVERGGQNFIEYIVKKKRKIRAEGRAKIKEVYNVIPINARVSNSLNTYRKNEFKKRCDDPDNPLFMTLGKHGPHVKQGITPKAVDCIVSKYARLARIAKRITPHSFRASYATHSLTSGMDLKTVSELLGHSSISATEPYLRSNLARKKKAAEVFCFI
jgi:integrase/recombinase XerD